MQELIEKYLNSSKAFYRAMENRKNAIIELVAECQTRFPNGIVEFDNNCPSFYNVCSEEYETIAAARVTNGVLELNSDEDNLDDEGYWFVPDDYGKLEYEDFVAILIEVTKNRNTKMWDEWFEALLTRELVGTEEFYHVWEDYSCTCPQGFADVCEDIWYNGWSDEDRERFYKKYKDVFRK